MVEKAFRRRQKQHWKNGIQYKRQGRNRQNRIDKSTLLQASEAAADGRGDDSPRRILNLFYLNARIQLYARKNSLEKGREYYFSGYAYLGLQHVPRFTALVKEGIDRYGWLLSLCPHFQHETRFVCSMRSIASEITGAEDTVLRHLVLAGRLAISKWKTTSGI